MLTAWLCCFHAAVSQLFQDLWPELGDVAGAQSQDHVAVFCQRAQLSCYLGKGRNVASVFLAQLLNGFGYALASDSGNGLLAGRIYIQDGNSVSVGKGCTKLF